MKDILCGFLLVTIVTGANPASAETKNVAHGRMIYDQQCANCHDNSKHLINDIGPALFGVVGRRVGSVEGYKYSPALQGANQRGEIWSPQNLDRFLTSPEAMHHGTGMPMNFSRRADRRGIIDYLKTLKPKTYKALRRDGQ